MTVKIFRIALVAILMTIVTGLQAQTITGNVKDALGEDVIGATVLEKGTTNGTVTDIDGNYSIKVASGKTLVFSYIGMKTKEVKVSGNGPINVVLEDENTTLNEVVVVGYGTMKKKDLTGSVATVNSEALQAVPVASATEALQGKMAGVQITATEGSPDAEMKIRVRGGGSITGDNTPLFIVDGFPVESISDIPASDIEDMTVLKDASSTAIYGSRGANGVILVTTKSGKEGKVSVTYNAYYSWKKMAKKLDTLSPTDYVNWQWEYAQLRDNEEKFTNLFGNYQDRDLYANAPTNDWQDQVFGRTGHTFNHNLTINGGSEKTKFNFGYAHIDDKAIMVGSSFKRDNLSLKMQHKVNKAVTLDFNVRYSNTRVNGAGANESKSEVSTSDSRMKNVMIYPMFNFSDLSDGYDPDFALAQPLTSVYDADRQQSRQTFNMNGSFSWEIIKNLKLKVELGIDHYYNYDKRYYGTSTYNSRENGAGLPMAYFQNTTRRTTRNTNTLNYDFKGIFGKNSPHKLNVLLGQETISRKSDYTDDRLKMYPQSFSATQAWTLSSQGTTYYNNKVTYANDNLVSFFGRVNYDYESKYLVSATMRADGSSKFAKGHRWGYFPSAAVAWRISSESFMESTQNWLDDLKLRFSYGTAGNNNIPADQTTPIWSSSSVATMNNFTSFWQTGGTDSKNPQASNPELTWETTITRNIGLDFTLFGSKLSGSVEYYYNTTKDLLINFPVSGTGYAFQYRNIGETQNQGVEVTLNWHAINKKNYGLDLSANIGFNKNKVVELGGLQTYNTSCGWASTVIQNDYRVIPGQPVGQIYGYQIDWGADGKGRYNASDFTYDGKKWVLNDGVVDDSKVIGSSYLRPGAMRLKDQDSNGVVDEKDMVKIGDTNPKATGGFSISGHAYGFDLSANFTYSIGNDVYNANKIEYTTSYQYYFRNMIDIMAAGKRWTNLDADGALITDAAQLDAANANTTMWSPYSTYALTDWAVEDGSFLRLSTLTLGYTLPAAITKKAHINSLRFYATCYNVFCLTNYSGFDPEVSSRNKTALTPGVDYSAYPKSRQFVIGVNLNF